jgi:hypothetical protein
MGVAASTVATVVVNVQPPLILGEAYHVAFITVNMKPSSACMGAAVGRCADHFRQVQSLYGLTGEVYLRVGRSSNEADRARRGPYSSNEVIYLWVVGTVVEAKNWLSFLSVWKNCTIWLTSLRAGLTVSCPPTDPAAPFFDRNQVTAFRHSRPASGWSPPSSILAGTVGGPHQRSVFPGCPRPPFLRGFLVGRESSAPPPSGWWRVPLRRNGFAGEIRFPLTMEGCLAVKGSPVLMSVAGKIRLSLLPPFSACFGSRPRRQCGVTREARHLLTRGGFRVVRGSHARLHAVGATPLSLSQPAQGAVLVDCDVLDQDDG